MSNRSVLKRIEQAEAALKAQSIFSQGCICFPEKEPPFFGFPIEIGIADRVKCSLHGNRFKSLVHLYVPKWLREKLWKHLSTHSTQYQKACLASFPLDLWPAEEEETEDSKIFLKLKDGRRLLAYEPAWKRSVVAVTCHKGAVEC